MLSAAADAQRRDITEISALGHEAPRRCTTEPRQETALAELYNARSMRRAGNGHRAQLTTANYHSVRKARDLVHRNPECGQPIPGTRRHDGKAAAERQPHLGELPQSGDAALRILGQTQIELIPI